MRKWFAWIQSARVSPARATQIRAIGLENLAYIIYTSGSTGQPKDVLVRMARLQITTVRVKGYMNWAPAIGYYNWDR